MLRVDILIKVMKNVHLERSIGLHDGDRFLLHKVHLKKKKPTFLKINVSNVCKIFVTSKNIKV